jgi:hypothetical protein
MTKKKSQKKEIIYHIVNSLLSGALVFLGGLSTSGEITTSNICLSLVVSITAAIVQFKDYWKTQEGEYTAKLFNFLG